MTRLLWTLVALFLRVCLSLRYRIEVKGIENIQRQRPGGILFLPNHPALMDPLFNMIVLWPKYRPHGLAVEYIYRTPGLHAIMKLFNVLPIPEFDHAVNPLKVRKAEKALDAIAEGLNRGENFLFYPAGRLKMLGREQVGGASGAHDLVRKCPDANIVLVRTTGLWGSSFSRAYLGRTPNMGQQILHGLKVLLKNGLFFAPRRRILIEIESEPADLPRTGTRLEFNRALESWYNQYPVNGKRVEEEPLTRISYAFWKEEVLEPYQPTPRERMGSGAPIPVEVQEKVYGKIRELLDNDQVAISAELSLAHDLGLDSLNIAEAIAFLSQEFRAKDLHPEEFEIVQDLLDAAIGDGRRERLEPRPEPAAAGWPKEESRIDPALPLGRTIPEAFLNVVERMGNAPAAADDIVGVLSYNRLKRAALVLSEEIRKWPEEQVGILLPASVGAYLLILAVQLAGKVPVMLNWTLGPRPLEEMTKLSGVGRILTSLRFLERLSNFDLSPIIDQIVLLEDLRKNLPLSAKLKGFLLSLLPPRVTLALLGPFSPEDSAVILFTSGTEASPKGVPLSHRNILSNQRAAMQCVDLASSDVLIGILPPFHSFGFSVVGLFPILGGIRVVFSPDPTDSFALAEVVDRWAATIFCGAPSFIKGLFQVARPEQLKTVRYFISGAEKTPPELYKRVEQLNSKARLIEGYGITECAPILTIARPYVKTKGVGLPLPEVEVGVVHPETGEWLQQGSEGELVVRGPNVFAGYLGNPRSPFITIDGERWYRTGDMGRVESDGSVMLTGRLKRFAKMGGEMISLGAVEDVIAAELNRQGRLPVDILSIAVIADSEGHLYLFSTISLTKEEANELIVKGGLSRLVKITAVKKIAEIPLLGTGKTDYRKLQTLLK